MLFKGNKIFNILSLSRQAFGRYKLQIVLMTILGFLSGILEGIGVNALVPLFSFVTGNGSGIDDAISRMLKRAFLYFDVNFSLKYILIFIALLFVVKAIVLVIFNYINIRITTDYEEQTRTNLFRQTLKADWPYLLKQKLSYLETVLITDVEKSSAMLRQISTGTMTVTSLLIYIMIALNLSVQITVITLGLGGVLFLFFKPLISRTRWASKEATDVSKEAAHFVNENILGVKTIKAMDLDNKINQVAKKYFAKLKQVRIKIFFLKNVLGSVLQPISIIFICGVFAVSYKTPGFNFAALVAIIYLIQRIFQYIQQLQLSLHTINVNYPYLSYVLLYEREAINNREDDNGSKEFSLEKNLQFRDLSFGYNAKEILTKLNFTINKGEMIGLIGPSGAGKTTIVDLILRLLKSNSGQILLDEKDINDISMKQWRENIGYVSQDIFLKNDTVANNIKFYDQSISRQDIIEAAKMANIYDLIASQPKKFDTEIGERGVLLSAGQRQRIIIARILARKPKLLVLDEATSALDNESEVKIQRVIENLKGRVTVFVIAHRLSTVINCDRLLVLENGRIIEQGSPRELLKDKQSYFYKVYNIRNGYENTA